MTKSISTAFEEAARARGVGMLTFDDKKPAPFIGNISPPATQTYRDVIFVDNPSGYWRKGESSGVIVTDELSLNNGVYTGGPVLGQTGLINDADTCVDYTPPQYANITDSSLFTFNDGANDTPFSIEAWIRADNLSANRPIISKTEKTVTGGPNNEWLLGVRTTGDLVALVYDGVTGDNHFWESATGVIVPTTVYHVVVTYDGNVSSGLMYINGTSISVSYAFTGSYVSMPNTNSNVEIGARFINNSSFQAFFDGLIDEVAIYNHVLSAARVSAHYNAGL